MADTVFANGIYVESGLSNILDTSLVGIANDADVMESLQAYQGMKSALGFIDTPFISKDQKYMAKVGPTELDRINEGENKKIKSMSYGPKKGFEIKEWANKIGIGYLSYQYLKKSKTLMGASDTVKQEFANLAEQTKELVQSDFLTKRYEMVKLFTSGNVETASYGPGSATPNGEPLFDTAHPYLNGAATFSNYTTNSLTDANLQTALNTLKTGVRAQNGKYVSGNRFKLVVGRVLAVTARNILQTTGNTVGMYAGAGTSTTRDTLVNTFSYKGNIVELVEVNEIGELLNDGTTLGNAYNWFVINPEYIAKMKALRTFELYPTTLTSYKNDDNDDMYVSVRSSFAVDHFGAEAWVFWSFATS